MEEKGKRRATLQLKLGGMGCSFCANAIERALRREAGVEEVHVSIAHEEALVRYRPGEIDARRIRETLRSLGYVVRDPRKVAAFEEQRALEERERRDLRAAALVSVIAFAGMAGMWLGLWGVPPAAGWIGWLLASYVLFWNGRRVLRMAWGAARRGITNQHVLLTAGALGAYSGGMLGLPLPALGWAGLRGFPAVPFFVVAIFLATYHLLSGYAALRVRIRASESVRRLLEMQPPTARRLQDGKEEEVPVEQVRTGERVIVRPGERIPIDGKVEQGGAAVDQSMVTGEPLPMDKGPGDEVIGGSVSRDGRLVVLATRPGGEGFLQQVARQVEEAKAMKPGIVALVDRVLRYYVPVVLTIGIGALLFWALLPPLWGGEGQWVRAVYAAVTVLVMGYPCALGMATPLALIRGGGLAAERGILIRSGEAFHLLKGITHVVLDKTGTLTEGRPRLAALSPVAGVSEEELLRWAAAAEQPSEHPLARAIVAAARERTLALRQVQEFRALTGAGVSARIEGVEVLVGTPRLIGGRGIDLALLEGALAGQEARARTAVVCTRAGQPLGVLAIADAVKPDAREAVEVIKRLGLKPVILTGDNRLTAEAVAREIGIEQVFAQVLPQQKAERIRHLQEQGAQVAMVGDGINDAPALMQAHVGIAIGAGTDIAIESSDVVLFGERLMAVPEARRIGAESYRKTVQNLWLAFLFNGIGIPAAATGLLHPVWAMAAMAVSVTAVLLNSFGIGAGASRFLRPPEVPPKIPHPMHDEVPFLTTVRREGV